MKEFGELLLKSFEAEILKEEENFASIILKNPLEMPALGEFLKANKFKMLIDICGVDYPTNAKRFEVVYQFLNMEENLRLTVKVPVEEGGSVPSIAFVFSSACWFERETYDMYGIQFSEAKDLRRILTDYDFEGFPLRKDFPLTGFVELKYDVAMQKIVKHPVNLSQEYRVFDFESPWENVQYNVKRS